MLAILCLFLHTVAALSLLQDVVLQRIEANLARGPRPAWVIGTQLEAVTELHYPQSSGFGKAPFSSAGPTPTTVVDLARSVVIQRDGSGLLVPGSRAASDTASIGTGVILASFYGSEPKASYSQPWLIPATAPVGSSAWFMRAAYDQMEFLLTKVQRTPSGIISHAQNNLQIWSDAGYMHPTFMAYYAVATGNRTIMEMAIEQAVLIHDALVDEQGTYRHILGGPNEDRGHWSTGTGWSVAGIVRIMATIQHSPWSNALSTQTAILTKMATKVLAAAWSNALPSGALMNYPDNAESDFADAASTALIASATFRLAALTTVSNSLLDSAEKGRSFVQSQIDADGWLTQVVNPVSIRALGERSPEAQAFVLLMTAAHRDLHHQD
ncbi:uncharacterized protein L969DRAFT_46363 [Mixia osmundae IAM 14324]|uniref:Uncharacterized protein n=1 Tax=Mixia osmundae (strain CBS 9802 / IAM 14324 / JCM 22182 / KY 12970) TaxID=764103 RepID=G7E614_MIXOS|nr:uncharacterized protein L969DRAFT_46363 [Mixia osmundae IAM 14324]KEI40577.1 hypothetical protein L969DRAFT_46363 [Mixia osmundae IAM 14324]GAA98274.1 hypothetical protein E5Q_04957 [Mixia osmundae IAM 14324]